MGSLTQVDAVLLLEFVGDVIDQDLIEIVAAQVGVAVGGLDLEDAVADVENGNVEGAAAQVEDGDLFVLLLVESIRQGRGGRLVDDAHALLVLLAGLRIFDLPFGFEAGDLGGIDGSLPLGVVEVGGHGDDGLAHGVAEVGLGGFLELAQDQGGDLRAA